MTYLAITAIAILGMFAANHVGYRAGVEAGREQAETTATRSWQRGTRAWWSKTHSRN